jgi:hypothetical protein
MRAKKLLVTVYREDGWGAQSHWVLDPTWNDVEAAIHELDRFRRPFIWIYLSRDAHQNDLADFEVIGGDGTYAMSGLSSGRQVRYFDAEGGEELVPIWTSDQGAEFAGKYICSHVAVVLEAARYFCEFGELDPKLTWIGS